MQSAFIQGDPKKMPPTKMQLTSTHAQRFTSYLVATSAREGSHFDTMEWNHPTNGIFSMIFAMHINK